MGNLVEMINMSKKTRLVLNALSEGRVVDAHWALANGVYSITKEIHRIRESGYNVDTLDREHGIAQYRMAVA